MNTHYEMITNETVLNQYLGESADQPLLILKHSTTCPISANAHKEFVKYLEEASPKGELDQIKVCLIRVIEERPLSLKLAELVHVTHQSPQLLLIKNGECVYMESHWKITKSAIATAVNAL